MDRAGVGFRWAAVGFGLALHLHLHLHHQFHGPAIDYVGLAIACAASWAGLPGPGEPLLIAAGIVAAKNNLSIASVIFVAFVAASIGGVAGWLIGLRAGRRLLTAPGPFQRLRLRLLARGDDVFARYTVIAIILTPPMLAGIHRVRTGVYLVTNCASAAVWAAGIGLAAYFAGPPIVEFLGDLGWISIAGIALLICAVLGGELVRRRRRRDHHGQELPAPD